MSTHVRCTRTSTQNGPNAIYLLSSQKAETKSTSAKASSQGDVDIVVGKSCINCNVLNANSLFLQIGVFFSKVVEGSQEEIQNLPGLPEPEPQVRSKAKWYLHVVIHMYEQAEDWC